MTTVARVLDFGSMRRCDRFGCCAAMFQALFGVPACTGHMVAGPDKIKRALSLGAR